MDVKKTWLFMTPGNICISKRKKSGIQNKMMPQYLKLKYPFPRPN